MDKLIISFAKNGRDAYEEIQKGLIETLPVAGDCDHWILNEYPEGITPHSVTPYLFKFDLIQKAVKGGYKLIWWLDSTMRLLHNPFELIEQSECGVVAFHNLGHPLYPKYLSDVAEENLKNYYTDITTIESTWGGALGFDFNKPTANFILQKLFHQASKGSFDNNGSNRNGFVAHRHDQSCMSVLFNYYEVPLLEYGIIAAREHISPKTYIKYGN